MKYIIHAALLAAMLSGCKEGGEEAVATPAPALEVVAFEGKLDPTLASVWETEDGKSTLELKADGSANLKSNVPTPGGNEKSEIPGKWKAGAGTLLIKKDSGDTIRYYTTQKDSDTLELRRLKDSKIKVVYKRKA